MSEELERVLMFALLGGFIVVYGLAALPLFVDLPTALVCETGRTDVHIAGGSFEEYRVGPCTFYNPETRSGD